MLKVIMLTVASKLFMLNVIMLNVIMLNVVAPGHCACCAVHAE
jgi:hypothetical protein